MKTYEMATQTGHMVTVCVGDASFFTFLDGKKLHAFGDGELADALDVSADDVTRFVGGFPTHGETTTETMLVVMKLMCLCGYSNSLAKK